MELIKFSPWNWFKKEDASYKPGNGSDHKNALSPILQLHREMDRLFDNMLGLGGPSLHQARSVAGALLPCVNVSETAEDYRLDLELPGVSSEDVELTVKDRTLAVRGEKRSQTEEKDRSYHRIERTYGSFHRLFSLPEDADEDKIQANFNQGVLTIQVARKATSPEPAARKIPILASSAT